MASQGYYDWIAAGKPFTLAAPQRRLRDILRGYGYTVYDIGNERHQKAEPPEDHMPYSATGWPNRSPRWYGFALDIMPPEDAGLPALPQLLGQIYADKMAGHPGVSWLKYMNWEPSGPSGPCYHDSWQPGHARRTSGDRGHGHLSGRSDHYLTDTSGGYDPVARWRTEGDDMALTADEVQAACLKAIHQAVDIAANRSNPTGRQIGDDLTALLAPLSGKLDAISAAVAELESEDMTQTQLDAFADAVAARLTPIQAQQLANALTLRFAPTSSN